VAASRLAQITTISAKKQRTETTSHYFYCPVIFYLAQLLQNKLGFGLGGVVDIVQKE
tara:strand:- start:11 stop:181 length:171 start_codon:yes stop_codon:yes gene_type:complete